MIDPRLLTELYTIHSNLVQGLNRYAQILSLLQSSAHLPNAQWPMYHHRGPYLPTMADGFQTDMRRLRVPTGTMTRMEPLNTERPQQSWAAANPVIVLERLGWRIFAGYYEGHPPTPAWICAKNGEVFQTREPDYTAAAAELLRSVNLSSKEVAALVEQIKTKGWQVEDPIFNHAKCSTAWTVRRGPKQQINRKGEDSVGLLKEILDEIDQLELGQGGTSAPADDAYNILTELGWKVSSSVRAFDSKLSVTWTCTKGEETLTSTISLSDLLQKVQLESSEVVALVAEIESAGWRVTYDKSPSDDHKATWTADNGSHSFIYTAISSVEALNFVRTILVAQKKRPASESAPIEPRLKAGSIVRLNQAAAKRHGYSIPILGAIQPKTPYVVEESRVVGTGDDRMEFVRLVGITALWEADLFIATTPVEEGG